MQLMGVYVHDAGTVEILETFAFSQSVKITWHGVRLARTQDTLKIKFPSGDTRDIAPDAALQLIRDPNYDGKTRPIIEPEPPASLPGAPKPRAQKIEIPVEAARDIDPDDGLWGAVD